MTKLSVFIATSIDGFIATPDGRLDWLEDAAGTDDDYGWDAFLAEVDALAMGRGTWDHIAHLDELPFGDRPVYVFTHRPLATDHDVSTWSCSPHEALETWRQRGLERVYVDGGQLISAFVAEGLIDDMTILTAPVLLGSGIPLFSANTTASAFPLEGVGSWPSGFVERRYVRR